MANLTVSVIRKDTDHWKKLTKGAFGGQVLVGIQEGSGSEDETTLAQIAQWLHDGTSEIPPRPFLTGVLNSDFPFVRQIIQRIARGVLNGKIESQQGLQLLGQWGRDRVLAAINMGRFERNADSTIRAKGSDTPLIDTGQLKSSITYVVEMDSNLTAEAAE
jgi:hypothetical protein